MNLSEAQKIQEVQYKIPYHWFKKPDMFDGRMYFGYLSLALRVLKKFPSLNNVRAAEFGSGDGRFLGLIREAGVHDVTGVDYSQDAIAFSRLLVPEAKYTIADFTKKLSFEDNSFDLIFLVETLEHLPPESIPSFFKEVHRVLRSDGYFVITVPSVLVPVHPKHYQHFSTEKIHSIMSDFHNVKIIGQDNLNKRTVSLLYKLLDNRFWVIKPLAAWFNTQVWTKHVNESPLKSAGRFIIFAQNNK